MSKDLVHWRELPIAFAPEKDLLAPDGIWSGSAAYDADGLPLLFFTAGNDSASPNQSVALARRTYSEDLDPDLIRWIKHPEPLIVQEKGIGAFGDFRDPFVWKDEDGWYALVGSGNRRRSRSSSGVCVRGHDELDVQGAFISGGYSKVSLSWTYLGASSASSSWS